jgi:O-antigen/teichoic acid export membrane protein
MPQSIPEKSGRIRPRGSRLMHTWSGRGRVRGEGSLLRKGIFGVGWSTLGQAIEMVVRIVQTVIMSRLLNPDDYAILLTAMVIVTTIEWFSDLGVLQALMRHPEGMSSRYLMTGWTVNVIRGAALSALVIAIAGPAARINGVPILAPVLSVIGLMSLLQALKTPNFPVLQHDMNFRGLFFIKVAATLVNTAVTIPIGYLTHSVWSMVAGIMAGTLVSVLASYLVSPRRPEPAWDPEAVGEIGAITAQVLPNTIAMALLQNSMRLVALPLGLVSLTGLGLFGQAATLAGAGETYLMAGTGVYFSMLCRIRDADERQRWHRRAMLAISLLLMPAVGCISLMGPWVVRLLYDARYHGSGVPLSIMTCRVMSKVIGSIQYQSLTVRGRLRFTTFSYLVAWAAEIALLFAFHERIGLLGLALLSLASSMVQTLTQAALARRYGEPMLPVLITFGVIAGALLVTLQLQP